MRLEHIRVTLRPRNAWEAMDLGFAIARRWAGSLWGAWLLCVLPLQWTLTALLWWVTDSFAPGLVLVWWFKPLYDRVALMVLSRGLFGERPSPREVAVALPKLLRHDLISTLLLRRLTPSRSLLAPVCDLERLRGSEARQRRQEISRGLNGAAAWLTFASGSIDLAVQAGLIGAVFMLIPDDPVSPTQLWLSDLFAGDMPSWTQWLWYGATYLSMAVVEPLYVAAGFGLYIHRRTQIEGWDVELTFRRMSARLRRQENKRRPPKAAALLVLLASSLSLVMLHAQPLRGAPSKPLQAQPVQRTWPLDEEQRRVVSEAMNEVEALPELGGKKMETVWRLKKDWQWELDLEDKHEEEETLRSPRWLSELLGTGLELVLSALFGLVIAGGLTYLFLRQRSTHDLGPPPPHPRVGPSLEGMLDGPAPPASEIPARGRALWRQGAHTRALGLLYAGAVRRLDELHHLELADDFTEQDCLHAVRGRAPDKTEVFFEGLVRAWTQAAYAHRVPSEASFDALCDGWSEGVNSQSRGEA